MPANLLAFVLLALALLAARPGDALGDKCLYLSHQQQHEVMIYKVKVGAVPPSVPHGKVYPNRFPTGLAIKDRVLYVASYGDLRKQPPTVAKYDVKDYLKALGPMKTGPELQRCYPEGLAIDGDHLYVGCGMAQDAAVLKYDLRTEQLVKVLAKGMPAVFGVALRNGEVFFASHCTSELVNGKPTCNLYEHDKIFRVPIDGTPDDVKEFAKLPLHSDGEWREAGWTGLSFGPNGKLYAASKTRNDVFIFNAFGAYEDSVVLRHMERASDVVFGPDGWGYVGNAGRGRVVRFNPENEREGDTFAEPGPDIVDSRLTYLLWAECPRLRTTHDEL